MAETEGQIVTLDPEVNVNRGEPVRPYTDALMIRDKYGSGAPSLVTSRGKVPWSFASVLSPTSEHGEMNLNFAPTDSLFRLTEDDVQIDGHFSDATLPDGERRPNRGESLELDTAYGFSLLSDFWDGATFAEPLGENAMRDYGKALYNKILSLAADGKTKTALPQIFDLTVTRPGTIPGSSKTCYASLSLVSRAMTTLTTGTTKRKSCDPEFSVNSNMQGFALYLPMIQRKFSVQLKVKMTVAHLFASETYPDKQKAVNNAWRLPIVFDLWQVAGADPNRFGAGMRMQRMRTLENPAFNFTGAEVSKKEASAMFDIETGTLLRPNLFVIIPRLNWSAPSADTFVNNCIYDLGGRGNGLEILKLPSGSMEYSAGTGVSATFSFSVGYVGPV